MSLVQLIIRLIYTIFCFSIIPEKSPTFIHLIKYKESQVFVVDTALRLYIWRVKLQ